MFWIKEKFVSLHRKTEMKCSIGLWCNGNTTDSGPVIPGSKAWVLRSNRNGIT